MGRVARYKKVKSIDPFAKNGSWKSDVGDCATLKRVRRKSKTALKMKEQKINKLQRRGKKKKDDDDVVGRKGGGSNGWGDDEGYDLPPEGGDDFDMNDIMGSVKKQKRNKLMSLLLEDDATAKKLSTPVSSYTKVSSSANNGNVTNKKKNNKVPEDKTIVNKKKLDKLPYDGTTPITAKTSTREIIASCSNPTSSKKQNKSNNINDDGTNMKQEKRKAFFEKKKLKKKHKRGGIDDESDDDDTNIHGYSISSSTDVDKTTEINKKHIVKQQNYSDTIAARSVAFNIQVERPPTFTMLPRGANKLAKNQKTKMSSGGERGEGDGCDDAETVTTAQRIQKEKQEMEAMRERVMRQYAILRESRRK